MPFVGNLGEPCVRERAPQHFLVGETECSWGADRRWGDLKHARDDSHGNTRVSYDSPLTEFANECRLNRQGSAARKAQDSLVGEFVVSSNHVWYRRTGRRAG